MKLKKGAKETLVNNYLTEDGEVLETTVDIKHHMVVTNDGETFAMVFGSVIGLLDGLDKMSVKVLVWCSQNCLLNSNIINLGKAYRANMCKEFDVADQTVKNAVSILKLRGALIHIGCGTYKLHPRYFWRGDMGTRRKALKYILEIELRKGANT